MGDSSTIEWTDATWNPTRGCQLVSPGCASCYAMRQAHRFSGPGGPYAGLTKLGARGPIWTGEFREIPEMLAVPLHWRKPRRVFVDSMSDLFGDGISNEFIAAVFGIMAACPQHTFQVLTKRAERMARWFAWVRDQCWPDAVNLDWLAADAGAELGDGSDAGLSEAADRARERAQESFRWPLANVWIGVSVEDQPRADARIPHLLRCPAAVRFVSAEPLIGPVRFTRAHQWCPTHDFPGGCCVSPCPDLRFLDWLIIGGESGTGARPFDLAWARSLVAQCHEAGVACFVKQFGAAPRDGASEPGYPPGTLVPLRLRDRKGGDPAEWPVELRVREFPHVGGGAP